MATAYLDTHIALWMHDGLIKKLSPRQTYLIETHELLISEFTRLELQYLYETGRIKLKPDSIIKHLKETAEIRLSVYPLNLIINEAMKISWTRDPFDRLITSNAMAEKAALLTKDESIIKNCRIAVG